MKTTILFLLLLVAGTGAASAQIFALRDSLSNSDTLYTEWKQVTFADTTWELAWAVIGQGHCAVELQLKMDTARSGFSIRDSISTSTGYAKTDTVTLQEMMILLLFPTTPMAAIDFLARIDGYWYYRFRIRTLASGNAGYIFVDD